MGSPLWSSGWDLGSIGLVGGAGLAGGHPTLSQHSTCLCLPQIMAALDANPTTKRTQLQHKFDQVIALMEDNIYESCSEA